jgi:hypothetical protein
LPSPIALAVKATKAEAPNDRPSDFKGVDDQTDTDQQESTGQRPGDHIEKKTASEMLTIRLQSEPQAGGNTVQRVVRATTPSTQ